MTQALSGPGVGLQLPQLLYPSNLTNGEVNTSTNNFTLAPGEAMPIPAGRWLVSLGKYTSLQYNDPVTGIWRGLRDNDNNNGMIPVLSDGFNVRVANLTGCAVGAFVTNGGNGSYVQATTVVSPSTGNSTWQAVVGGAVNTTVSVTTITTSLSYGIAPLVFFDAPPNPGVCATGVAVISSGTLSSITVVNQGAGYTSVPNITILPNPADPNLSSGTPSSKATCSLTGTGSVTAVLCTNPGASVATTMTLTITGSGASATATPLFLETVTQATIVNTANYNYSTFTMLTTMGGNTTSPSAAFTNPDISLANFVPRPAQMSVATSSGTITSVTSIIDAGLFITAPTPLVLSSSVSISTIATFALNLGGTNSHGLLQQLG